MVIPSKGLAAPSTGTPNLLLLVVHTKTYLHNLLTTTNTVFSAIHAWTSHLVFHTIVRLSSLGGILCSITPLGPFYRDLIGPKRF